MQLKPFRKFRDESTPISLDRALFFLTRPETIAAGGYPGPMRGGPDAELYRAVRYVLQRSCLLLPSDALD